MESRKIHKGYRLAQETLDKMDEISSWYGDIDQTQVLTIAVAELWHHVMGEKKRSTLQPVQKRVQRKKEK